MFCCCRNDYCRGIAFEIFHFKLKPKYGNEGKSSIICLICGKEYRSVQASFALVHRRFCGGYQCVNLNSLPRHAVGFENAFNIIPNTLNTHQSENTSQSGKSSTTVDVMRNVSESHPYSDLRNNYSHVIRMTNPGNNGRTNSIIDEFKFDEVYIQKSNKAHRAAQCLRCGKIIKTVTTIRLAAHR